LYFSVHSAVANLAPAGGAVIHAAKHLNPTARTEPKADERELEEVLDLMQPGWREVVVERRFLPSMTVAHAVTTATAGGRAGRPGPAVPRVRNLYVVGDWVGPEGLLADASLASAKQAADLVMQNEGIKAAA
jgi:phytoene dehydrogenase-like protein